MGINKITSQIQEAYVATEEVNAPMSSISQTTTQAV